MRIMRTSGAAAAAAAMAVGAVVILIASSSAWSQTQESATTQPRQPRVLAGDPGDQSYRGAGQRRFDGRGDGMRPPPPPPSPRGMEWHRGDARSEDFSEPTAEQWKEIEAFMGKHSPERFKRLEELGDEQRRSSVRSMFAARYRALRDLEKQDPELYQIRLKRMPIEDKVFDLSWQLSRKLTDKPEETKSHLRQQLRLLIKNRFEERASRLRRMEKRLKEDEQRVDELVEANMSDIAEANVPRDLRPQPGPPRRERRDEETPYDANATPTTGEQ